MSRLSFSRYHSRETPRAPTTRLLLLYLTNSTFFDLDWFPYKNKPSQTSPPPPPSLSKNTKGCDHPANSLTGVASKPNQTLCTYNYIYTSCISLCSKLKKNLCPQQVSFLDWLPNKFKFSQKNCVSNKLPFSK